MKWILALLLVVLPWTGLSQSSKSNRTEKADKPAIPLTMEQKWQNYLNANATLKAKVQQLELLQRELDRAQGDLAYKRKIESAKRVSKGLGELSRHDTTPEIQRANELVAKLASKIQTLESSVKVERLQWEQAMMKAAK